AQHLASDLAGVVVEEGHRLGFELGPVVHRAHQRRARLAGAHDHDRQAISPRASLKCERPGVEAQYSDQTRRERAAARRHRERHRSTIYLVRDEDGRSGRYPTCEYASSFRDARQAPDRSVEAPHRVRTKKYDDRDWKRIPSALPIHVRDVAALVADQGREG